MTILRLLQDHHGRHRLFHADDAAAILGEGNLGALYLARTGFAAKLRRELEWISPAGQGVRIRSTRLVSLVHRHVAAIRFEVTMLHGSAPVLLTSRLLNRQDAEFEADPGAFTEAAAIAADGLDPIPSCHGSADFRRHLARVLTARALRTAFARATSPKETTDAR